MKRELSSTSNEELALLARQLLSGGEKVTGRTDIETGEKMVGVARDRVRATLIDNGQKGFELTIKTGGGTFRASFGSGHFSTHIKAAVDDDEGGERRLVLKALQNFQATGK